MENKHRMVPPFLFMKRTLLFILTIAISILAKATDIVEIDGIFYELKPVKVGTASVTSDPAVVGYKLYAGDISIPATIEYEGNTYKVTEIAKYAFMGCRELLSATLPDGLTTIGFGAFDGCSSLISINIPSSVTTIDQWAFRECAGLTAVSITDIAAWCGIAFGDYSNPLYYAKHLFVDGKEITELRIPDNVTSIGDRAFNGFEKLQSVELGNGVKSIGSYAFAWCNLLSTIVIPENVETIGSYAFYECIGLSSLSLSNQIEKIANRSFSGCSSLEELNIPYGIKEIDNGAFEKCKKLKKIYISESVEKIGAGAFGNCENITDVYCLALIPPVPNTFYYSTLSNYFWQSYINYSTLHVPESSIDSYKNAFTWSDFGTIIALTNEETSIQYTKDKGESSMQYYSLGGNLLKTPRKGINIIKLPNGKVKTVIVK